MFLEFNDKTIKLDQHGFIENRHDWCQEVALTLASQEQITLTPEHWEIIDLLQHFYTQHQHIPPLRLLVKLIANALGPEKGSSLYLYKLFPEAPVRKICRIAGLPKPRHCL